MKALRALLLILGLLAVLVGAIWIGQGTGLFPYPASSFMIGVAEWAYYGGGAMLIGVVVVVVSRKI